LPAVALAAFDPETMLAIRVPTQKRQAAPLDRGGAFHLLVATIQFAGQR
jgi:hypothetical protein